jgi:hypothetical protein
MGEYATYNGQSIKIGTCEQMYYLRADQVHLIKPESGSVNPQSASEAGSIRFRFPFPQEDGIKPGAFDNYDYGFGLYGVDVPEDIDHNSLQFTRNYPQSGGILLSTPCPRSKEGKASGLKFAYNGYCGPVYIHSQRLKDGQLKLVLRCGDCGALYRQERLDDCKQVLEALEKLATSNQSDHNRTFYTTIAQRIIDGYTKPNYWSGKPELVTA